MPLMIALKTWSVLDRGDKGKTISGTYSVKSGDKEVASQVFNAEYGGSELPFPAALLAEAEELGEKVRLAVEANFGN